MVNLKYVDNPFTDDMMYSIECFREEKSFYDCVNRKFLHDDSFLHLDSSFYTYFLTGNDGEWIGYILLNNPNKVKGYFSYYYQEIIPLINNLEKNSFDNNMKLELDNLKNEIISNNFDLPVRIIDEKIRTIILKYNREVYYNLFNEFNNKLNQYLVTFPNYYYLDIVIALPKDEEKILLQEGIKKGIYNANLLAEEKYCGFIQDACNLVECEICNSFANTSFILKNDNQNIFMINPQLDNKTENKKEKKLELVC